MTSNDGSSKGSPERLPAVLQNAGLNVLETARLALRRLTVDDAGFVLELLNEPSFIRFIGDRGIRTASDATAYILNGPIASYERFGFGLYLATLKEASIPIGLCGLLKRETFADVDIGFAFLPRFWSQGYAVESAAAVLEHGRQAFGLRRVIAITQADNSASISVLRKLGLQFEGVMQLSAQGSTVQVFGRAI